MLESIFDRITRASIRFKWVTIALAVVISVAGVLAFGQLKRELIPSIEFPQTVVLAFYNGAESQTILDEVTIPLEDAIRQVEGVVNIESTTSNGVAFLIARNEFGLDQEAVRTDIQAAVDGVEYPEGMETPEILTFSFSDLPIASVSVSSEGSSLAELKTLVESEIIPQLEAIDGVGGVEVSGGQELPTEPPPTPIPSPTPTLAPTATPTEEPSPTPEPTEAVAETPGETPVALPDSWIQAAAAQGQTLETTADLTPEIVAALASFAPQMLAELTPEMLLAMPVDALTAVPADFLSELDPELRGQLAERLAPPGAEPEPVSLPDSWIQAAAAQGQTLETTADLTPEIVAALASFAPQMLAELTPEMLLAMPVDALAALPADFLAELDPELRGQLAERLAPPGDEPEPVALPESWIQAAAAQGQTLETTADLTPEIVAALASFAPQMLADLTPEMLLAMPVDALGALPADYLAELDPELQAQLAERAGAGEAPAEEETDPRELPAAWQAAGASQNITLVFPEDITPEILRGVAEFAPQLLDALTPVHLQGLSPEVLGWLPAAFVEFLDPDLKAELDSLASEVGGAGALAAAAEEEAGALAEGAPELTGSWLEPPEGGAAAGPLPQFETAADLVNNGFTDSAAALLNTLVENAGELAPDLIGDLSPEVIAWLIQNEESFLENLSIPTLRLLSPEVLAGLPEEFLASLDEDLRQELAGIAAGTVEVFVPTATITRVDGNPSLGLSVFQDQEANTVAVSHVVFDKLDELEAANPGLQFFLVFEQASFIEESINGVTREGALGALFAVLVILIFLSGRVNGRYTLSWRSTLVIAVSIPLSILMAFALLKWLPPLVAPLFEGLANATAGIPILGALTAALQNLFPVDLTLNIMTLSGMTVAVGRVVDDSIVVLENTYRHIQRGEERLSSVLIGARDVSIAIFASTITTVVVFLPIGLLGGLIGGFFLPFGIAVTYALISSFLVAITVIPVLAYLFIRKEHLPAEHETSLQRRYTPILEWALGHRGTTLAIAGVLFIASLYLISTLPRAFLPDFGEVQINVAVDMPGEVQMAETDALAMDFEAGLAEIADVGTVKTEIGSAGGLQAQFLGGGVDQGQASIQVGVENTEDVDALTAEIRSQAEAAFGPDNVIVSSGSLSSGAFGAFALVASGDPEQLAAFNQEAIDTLNEVDGLANVASNLTDQSTILRVDSEAAVRFTGELETEDTLGVTSAAKAALLGIAPGGVTISEGFETQQQTEGFTQAVSALGVSVIAVYFVLVVTFRSFIHPFTILFSLPMAVIGAALALWVTDSIVGLSTLVGMMMLVGIVVTNAIVLLDRVQANRTKREMNAQDALVEAGRTRLRPILMTATAAILALVPLAIGLSQGAIVASELAIVVIGGLATSTLLTLVIVPVMYRLLDRLTHRKQSS